MPFVADVAGRMHYGRMPAEGDRECAVAVRLTVAHQQQHWSRAATGVAIAEWVVGVGFEIVVGLVAALTDQVLGRVVGGLGSTKHLFYNYNHLIRIIAELMMMNSFNYSHSALGNYTPGSPESAVPSAHRTSCTESDVGCVRFG